MSELHLSQNLHSKTGMLIRKPIEFVFEALVNPALTTQFWFTASSGWLEQGKTVTWEWAMYDVAVEVTPLVVQPPSQLVIEWPGYAGLAQVTWSLQALPNQTTYVEVAESGFTGTAEAIQQQLVDSTEGFCLVLAGLKAWLEHGIALNLVADRFPAGYHAAHEERK
ncbi:SRPBCC family protein [Herpetosiphon geysericola]|uniref:Activator of Hsp90 ATPase homologue 1/2-like C-terminal domain-containing protein n=1 Tax=Herpetosiphon geysericola TaxID=70996 RepID=A0A0P6Z032_9CHLR|nr:SRPBCC family protein [Herpetosiphon geysericola]KPL90124.1 hypothetical protein SE18_07885 [Herpetosiphon geysericola]